LGAKRRVRWLAAECFKPEAADRRTRPNDGFAPNSGNGSPEKNHALRS